MTILRNCFTSIFMLTVFLTITGSFSSKLHAAQNRPLIRETKQVIQECTEKAQTAHSQTSQVSLKNFAKTLFVFLAFISTAGAVNVPDNNQFNNGTCPTHITNPSHNNQLVPSNYFPTSLITASNIEDQSWPNDEFLPDNEFWQDQEDPTCSASEAQPCSENEEPTYPASEDPICLESEDPTYQSESPTLNWIQTKWNDLIRTLSIVRNT